MANGYGRTQARPATAGQVRLLQTQYGNLRREGDPRTLGTMGTQYPDDRAGRLAWASDVLGVRVESFSHLTEKQAEYLCDWLCKGPGHAQLDWRLRKCFEWLGVADPEAWWLAWWRGNKRHRAYWHFQGRTLAQLTRGQKISLVTILDARMGARADTRAPEARADTRAPEARADTRAPGGYCLNRNWTGD